MENEEPAEVYILNSNNTNLSDTEMNDNKSNHIISVDEKRFDSDNRSEDYQAYENLARRRSIHPSYGYLV